MSSYVDRAAGRARLRRSKGRRDAGRARTAGGGCQAREQRADGVTSGRAVRTRQGRGIQKRDEVVRVLRDHGWIVGRGLGHGSDRGMTYCFGIRCASDGVIMTVAVAYLVASCRPFVVQG